MSKTSNSRRIVSWAVLGLLVAAFLGLLAWKLRPPEDIPAPKLEFHLASKPDAITRTRSGSIGTVVERLVVNVKGSPEAVEKCRVLANVGSGQLLQAERVAANRFLFSKRLVTDDWIVALANMGTDQDASTGRDIPAAHLSEYFVLGRYPAKEITLELRPAACLTVVAKGADGAEIPDAAVGVDFTEDSEATGWVQFCELAGIAPLHRWLSGEAGKRSQVPLLRSGTRLRLTAQSGSRMGTTEPFVVKESGSVEINLHAAATSVELAFTNADGRSVGRVSFSAIFKGGPKSTALRTSAAQSDDGGLARLSGAAGETSVDVKVVSDDWRLEGGTVNVPLDGAKHTLVLKATLTVKIEVRYEDDEPYVGPLTVSADPRNGFARVYSAPGVLQDYGGVRGPKPQPDPTGVYTVCGVPADADMVVSAFPQRTGFGYLDTKVNRSELIPNGYYLLKIPRATKKQPSAKIVFAGDLAALRDAEVKVVPIDSPYPVVGPIPLATQKETYLLFPGKYRVELTGKGIAWQSDDFTLKEGETRTVELQARAAASAMATILDHEGKAITGAAMCRNSGTWVDFPARANAWLAVTDAAGRATLGNLPEGKVELRLEADGFEPEIIQAVLSSGIVTDLGVFKLRPARGEIRITIKNFERIAGLNPRIDLMVAGGRGGGQRGPLTIPSSEYVFSRLPLGRTWSSAIGPAVGKSWKVLNLLRPTEAQPVVEVEVDAAEFDFDD